MKQNNIIKLVLLLVLYSVFANAKINWAPIMMGDITTFAPYAKTNTLQTIKDVYRPNEIVNVKVDAALSGDQDWVGVYHKNASSAWKNVVAWNWVPHNGTFALSDIKKTMPVGSYEARLFFHNKYEKKASYPFTVAVSNFQTTKVKYAPNETVSVIVNVPLSGTKDWVGIFKKNTSSNRANLIAWNYITKKGRFDISKKLISIMPAGEYEARLFFNDSYNVEQTFGFNVSGNNGNYSDYGTYNVVGPEKPYGEYIYVYKPTKNSIVRKNAPVVIYAKGGNAKYEDKHFEALKKREPFMKFLASKGYVVIGVRTTTLQEEEFTRILATLEQLGNIVDKSKIGIIGASSGGEKMFHHLRKLKEEHYASNSFLISLDGYFAADQISNVRKLNTTTLLLQFGGADGIAWHVDDNPKIKRLQDPRVLMALYNMLPGNEKSLSYLHTNDIHDYSSGSMEGKENLRRVVGAMLAYKFENGGQAARNIVLGNDKYEEIDRNKLPGEPTKNNEAYAYPCKAFGHNYCDVINPAY